MQIIKRTGKKEEVDNKRKGGNCYKFKKGGRKVDKKQKIGPGPAPIEEKKTSCCQYSSSIIYGKRRGKVE